MWHMTCDMWPVTFEGGEQALKVSNLSLIWFGCEGVFKMLEQNGKLLN